MHQPAIFADVNRNRLYAAETGITSPAVYIIDMDTGSILFAEPDAYSMDGPQRSLFIYRDYMVLGRYRTRIDDLDRMFDKYLYLN